MTDTTPAGETAAAIDPPRPDPVRAALQDRARRLSGDVRACTRILDQLHQQQDSTTRDLLAAQAMLDDTTAALAGLDAPELDTWDAVAAAANRAPHVRAAPQHARPVPPGHPAARNGEVVPGRCPHVVHGLGR